MGGERGVLLLQSSGVGNGINMLALDIECWIPLLALVTIRGGWGEFNPGQVPMGQAAQDGLETAGVLVARADHEEGNGRRALGGLGRPRTRASAALHRRERRARGQPDPRGGRRRPAIPRALRGGVRRGLDAETRADRAARDLAPVLDVRADGRGRWTDAATGTTLALDGCKDIDIYPSPFTNTLPIRRLNPEQIRAGGRAMIGSTRALPVPVAGGATGAPGAAARGAGTAG